MNLREAHGPLQEVVDEVRNSETDFKNAERVQRPLPKNIDEPNLGSECGEVLALPSMSVASVRGPRT